MPRSRAQRKADRLALLRTEVDCWVASADEMGNAHLVPLSHYSDGAALVLASPHSSPTVLQLTAEERELAREIETITRKLAPQLLQQPGVGPLAAAQLVLSWSHRGRISSEAAFARLAGCAPIPAPSGQTVRYRLDRSGDRRLNRALHTILVTRRRTHPPTIAYIQRRTQEGKSRREATRCLSATSPATRAVHLAVTDSRDLSVLASDIRNKSSASP